MADVLELLEAGEAKAYYGLAINWKPFEALVNALLDRSALQVRVAFKLGRDMSLYDHMFRSICLEMQ